MIGSDIVVGVVWGFLITIFIEILLLLLWLQKQPVTTPKSSTYTFPNSPQEIQQVYDRNNDQRETETCKWFNVITDFLFHELRDTQQTKLLIMKQIQKEFNELLLTKMEGKMIEELTVREYSLGDSLPHISDIVLVNLQKDHDTCNTRPQLIEAELSVSYQGSIEIKIDAQLMFGRAATVSLKLCRLEGRGRFQMTRDPFTHWSFTFLHDPSLEMSVSSRFEGRNLPRLSVFIEAQIKRWLKKKHTFPNYKVRFKPFFKKFKEHDQLQHVYLHNKSLTQGQLQVNIKECTRLRVVDIAVELYCILSIDSAPQEPMIGLWRNDWPYHELILERATPNESFGMKYVLFPLEEGKGSLVVISLIHDMSPAKTAGLRKGDVLHKIEHTKITSVEQARKLINKLSDLKVLITIQRPPTDLLKTTKKQNSKSRNRAKNDFRKSRSQTVVEPSQSLEDPALLHVHEHVSDSETTPIRRRRQRDFDTCSLQLQSTDSELIDNTPSVTVSQEHDAILIEGAPPTPKSHDCSQKTKTVAVNRNPQWDETFTFNINSKKQRYLNICVCSRLQGDEGDLMIGYVSLSLTDIAVECSLTSEGKHCQRYVLVPTKLSKIKASRAALKVTSGMNDLPATAKLNTANAIKKYVGDILLEFKHVPCEVTKEKNRKRKESVTETDDTDTKFSSHPFTAGKDSQPSRHQFEPVDLKRSEKRCHTCSSRIWKKALQCLRCGIISHNDCLSYCKKMVPCHSSRKGTEEASSDEETEGRSDGWVHLSPPQDTYSDSRTIYKRTNEIDFGPSLNEKEEVIESADCQNMTPATSSDEGEEERHSQLLIQNDSYDVSRESSRSPLPDTELESKILMAQESLEVLEIQRREILNSIHENMSEEQKEKAEYKLQKIDAQHETTEEILRLQKERLRGMM